MSVLVVGLSHSGTPVEVLERATVAAGDLPELLEELLRTPHVREAMLLSTCNRVEVYAAVDAFHGGLADIAEVLSRHAGTPLSEHLYVQYAGAAVRHLFAVAAGLDSMVVGEAQILGQLRTAYAEAVSVGAAGRVLHGLAQQALRVGKRVQAGTDIGAAGASVVSEALSDAAAALGGDLAGRPAVVVGAGAMGGLAAAHLRRAGVAEIVVVNRSPQRAMRLVSTITASGTAARIAPASGLAAELAMADVLVACTGAKDVVVDHATVAAAVRARAGRPLAVCDLGLPRDVDPGVAALPGVTVVDLAALQRRLSWGERGTAVAAARDLVADEAQSYLAGLRSERVVSTVTALRQHATELADAELARLFGRLPDLDAAVRDELSRSVRRVVYKLLHNPTVRVKRLADAPDGTDYADVLRELFGLDPHPPAGLTLLPGTDVRAALDATLDPTPWPEAA